MHKTNIASLGSAIPEINLLPPEFLQIPPQPPETPTPETPPAAPPEISPTTPPELPQQDPLPPIVTPPRDVC